MSLPLEVQRVKLVMLLRILEKEGVGWIHDAQERKSGELSWIQRWSFHFNKKKHLLEPLDHDFGQLTKSHGFIGHQTPKALILRI